MNDPIPSAMPSYLSALNEAQRDAVQTLEGPVLVLAGAGTGKTRVLTTRLAHMLHTGAAWPSQILAVTFTNKAAQEMKERVSGLLDGASVDGWWLGTFHAIAARMLRKHAELVGLSQNFTILDPDDQGRLLKTIIQDAGIDHKKWPPKVIANHIDRFKDRGLLPGAVRPEDAGDIARGKLVWIYQRYQERLKAVNACDFGDLLLHMITIFRNPEHAAVLEEYHRRFKYILVDEYQDTNVAQYLWLRLLAQGSHNICCVGDDDQSIYGWRGAEITNILRFEEDFPGAKLIRLEQNYRSTNTILKAAGAVIANNQGRLGKTLWSEAGEGEKIDVHGVWDGETEARRVSEEILQLQQKQWDLDQIAVLVRTGFQTREFEDRFIKQGIPYKVIGGPRFYERLEVRDALAYLRVVNQRADDLALERIINTPKRGLGTATLNALYTHGRERGICLYDAIVNLIQTDTLRPKVKNTLAQLIDDFARWRSLADTTPHDKLAAQILDESGYMQMWRDNKNADAPGRVDNLKELITGMAEYESLPVFLEHVALVMENQQGSARQSVSVMTLHGAKGLEFDAVFLPGWEDGLFPSQRAMDEKGLPGLEEERRLAYVGLTRARKKVYISFAANRRLYGQWMNAVPSRFVDEIPADMVQRSSETGLQGMHQSSSSHSMRHRHVNVKPVSDRKVINAQGATLARGDAVIHAKFGKGTIINIDGHKLDIQFETSGHKRIMDNFVTKAEG